MPAFRHLFGPVPSRRFGLSLGVDMVPAKTCSLNCVFCEVGRTTVHTLERREYVPTAQVVAELAAWSQAGGRADFITLCGSGEPTLHTGFGTVIDATRSLAGPRTALLSNGTLFGDPAVRRDAARADVVKLSLSAWDEESYARIHRPAPGVVFARMLEGYRAFRSEFEGQLWLEVFIVPGVNSTEEQVCRMAALTAPMHPDRIDLNTAVRPPAEPGVTAMDAESLARLARLFTPAAGVSGAYRSAQAPHAGPEPQSLLATLRRRPCSSRQLAAMYGIAEDAIEAALTPLLDAGQIHPLEQNGEQHFGVRPRDAK